MLEKNSIRADTVSEHSGKMFILRKVFIRDFFSADLLSPRGGKNAK